MSEKKRILLITQEMEPYTEGSLIAEIANKLPLYAHDKGMELRILMPRFGVINERRHRLHEVVRLSGMNIIVQNDDYPLIIKVASLPASRLQVYFLDNDEFFKRKAMFEDDGGGAYDDNADRMVFFCKGALETLKKFGWAPDYVLCHGWMTSLIPAYIKLAYTGEPLFQNAKVIYSMYDTAPYPMGDDFYDKAAVNNISADELSPYTVDGKIDLNSGAAHFADGVISLIGEAPAQLNGTPIYMQAPENEQYLQDYLDFFGALD